jgi:hypothetical protein
MRKPSPQLLLSIVALVSGCSDSGLAKETFAASQVCPEERVTATVRKDLDPIDLMTRPEKPPPEIAADVQRLELWNQQRKSRSSDWEGKAVVQVRGCDVEKFYVCGQLRVSVGATRRGCATAAFPPQ